MNFEHTKSIFDICLKDDIKTSEYQIQLPYGNSDNNDEILSIVTELFRIELADRYVTEYLSEGCSKEPEFMIFLSHHYDKAIGKNEFLTIFENLILPKAKETVTSLELLVDERQRGHFASSVDQWLIEQKTFLSINPIINVIPTIAEAKHYLRAEILFKIHQKFDGIIWEPIDRMEFLSVFDTNNAVRNPKFVVKKAFDFYALLWYMHDFKKVGTYNDFIKPLLKRYDLSTRSFDNIRTTRIDEDPDGKDKPEKKKKELRKKIQECLSQND